MSAPIKVELFDLGPHNGKGDPDANGSYQAFTLTEKGNEGDRPQSLTFMVPAHQLPSRADICTTDERVKELMVAAERLADLWDKDAMDRIGPATRQLRAALRDISPPLDNLNK